MSDTPRTDAAQHNMGSVTDEHYVVDVEFARELERELNEAVAQEVSLSTELATLTDVIRVQKAARDVFRYAHALKRKLNSE